ncbi:MAG: CotH kinase family protein [Clostridia bacterium]|nr:CotH kinase family protein [Clostridia bacterium]
MKKLSAIVLSSILLFSLCGCESQTANSFPIVAEHALTLSHQAGIYEQSFILRVAKEKSTNEIYYTTDGTTPTASSTLYREKEGILISDCTQTASYSLSNKSVYAYPEYKEPKRVHHATPLRLIEVDKQGNTVASKTASYIVKDDALSYYTVPVVCITSSPSDFFGKNGMLSQQNLANEQKYDMTVEFFDGDRYFSRSSKIKLGGNWTRYGFPNKTFNVNMKKDENGNKNEKIGFSVFGDQKKEDMTGVLPSTTRFRLHTGANDTIGSFFSDALVHRLSENLNVSTTSYRPCILYLNGEYWGLYALREWYSADYFEDNYGVDKDNVLYVDRTYSAWMNPYCMEIKDGDEELGRGLIDELMQFVLNADLSDQKNYEKLCSMVDMESLADLVLIHSYVGNWDFMYNNLRMWRTIVPEPGNPYGDCRWRFCVHDADFSFETVSADDGLPEEYKADYSYLDFFLGDAPNTINNLGWMSRELNCFFREPFVQNASFRSLVKERAQEVRNAFEKTRAKNFLSWMQKEISPLMVDHLKRWNRVGYTKQTWLNVCNLRKQVIEGRGSAFEADVINTLRRYGS